MSSSFHHQRPYSSSSYGGQQQQQEASGMGGEESAEDQAAAMRRGGGGEGSSSGVAVQREHMFDKVVTPSDVGKLNRLVIPKQHAEKYFPLDSSTNEKGLLLNFEDRNGKPWRFRYSYWNSSQSYVMTKGWSRFVKEKKLDAGDIVSFQRGAADNAKDRLFIDWRRRPDAPDPSSLPHHFASSAFHHRSLHHHPWSPLFLPPTHPHPPPRDFSHSHLNGVTTHHHYHHHPYAYGSVVNGNPCPPGSIVYLRGGGGGAAVMGGAQMQRGGVGEQMVFESVPVVQGKAAAKRLRLFGVNMDCPISAESDECDDDVVLSSSSSASASASAAPPSLQHQHHKGKGSMSLDLDI